MPEMDKIVINTGPLIALAAACGDLTILSSLYTQVLVPLEVCQEMLAGNSVRFAVAEFEAANWLQKWPHPLEIAPIYANSLDKGEAAVIQLALNEKVQTVCIDEPRGRRIARLSGLSLTGSIGILLRAKKEGYPLSIRKAIHQMKDKGIWLSERVIIFALEQSGEQAQ
jgi:predicted nucleic acid-binding protein